MSPVLWRPLAWPRCRPLRALAFLAAAAAAGGAEGDGNCGVVVPLLRRAGKGSEAYEPIGSSLGPPPPDLEDELWSLGDGDPEAQAKLRRLQRDCHVGSTSGCVTFGVHQWNLTRHDVVVTSGRLKGRLCEEDDAVWQRVFGTDRAPCNPQAPCRKIGGKIRLVGLATRRLPRELVEALAGFPHIFSLRIDGVDADTQLADLALPPSVQMLTLNAANARDAELLAPLLRNSPSVRSLHIYGNQVIERWLPLDLSLFCGMDLLRFSAFVFNVGSIPQCWGEMRRLESFYCTNCMMTSPPSALRGLKSLKSFVAFRQSEMTPCVAKKHARDFEVCEATFETRAQLKYPQRARSTGAPDDFQEGPSYKCPEGSYAFAFEEFLALGWDNVEKVWLDGNYLTGGIPESIAEHWPRLRSLDLYDNKMDGPIPESLARLDFVKLQLQGNNFSGNLPKGVAELLRRKRLVLGLCENPQLEGCAPHDFGLVEGTRLRICDEREEL